VVRRRAKTWSLTSACQIDAPVIHFPYGALIRLIHNFEEKRKNNQMDQEGIKNGAMEFDLPARAVSGTSEGISAELIPMGIWRI